MPPKVQVSKEEILDTAMALVFREGPGAITYQALARELGKSTQTIAWKFGSIGNLQDELAEYILEHFKTQIVQGYSKGKNPVAEFMFSEEVFLKLAFEQPNLVQFVRTHSNRTAADGGVGFVFDEDRSREVRKAIQKATKMTEKQCALFMKHVVVYAHGLVSLAMDNAVGFTYEEAVKLMRVAGIVYMTHHGVDEKTAKGFFA